MNLFQSRHAFVTTQRATFFRWFFLICLLVALPVFIWAVLTQRIELRKQAGLTGPTLTIQPATVTGSAGQTESLGIALDTKGSSVSAAEIHLTYDPSIVEIDSFTPQSASPVALSVILSPASIGSGAATITLGASPDSPFTGTAIIGDLEIKLLSSASAQITFADNSVVTAVGQTMNVLTSTTGVGINGATPPPITFTGRGRDYRPQTSRTTCSEVARALVSVGPLKVGSSVSLNWGGLNEKWFQDNDNQWYYIYMPRDWLIWASQNGITNAKNTPQTYAVMKWTNTDGLQLNGGLTRSDALVTMASKSCYDAITPSYVFPTITPTGNVCSGQPNGTMCDQACTNSMPPHCTSGTCQNNVCVHDSPRCVTVGQTCSGIGELNCPSGSVCIYTNGSTQAPSPDASGTCQISVARAQSCGGIRGTLCLPNTVCTYSNGTTRASSPDAMGTCRPVIQACPSPTPTVIWPTQTGCVKSPAYNGDRCDGYRLIRSLQSSSACYSSRQCAQAQGDGTCIQSPTYAGDRCNGYRVMPGISRSCYSLEECQTALLISPTPTPTPTPHNWCAGPNNTQCQYDCNTCTSFGGCTMMKCPNQSGSCQNNLCTPAPSGCRYQTMECLQAPCPVTLVCPTSTPTVTPTPTPNLNPPLCDQSSIPPATGPAPLTELLHGAGSAGNGPGFDGYRWDFDGNGTWDTDILSEPVTHVYTSPGSYVPLFQVHGVNNVWSALCTYPYTITVASPTPTPTPTPMPQNLEFLVKLGGVTGNSATGAQIGVKFSKKDGTVVQLSSPLTLSYVGSGVYNATATLTNPFAAGTQFTVQIKGEKHAAITFTHQSGQTNQCSDSEYITEPNPVPQAMTFDFSSVPLPPGDTNPQDGQVDQTDVSRIITLMGKSSGALTTQDRLTGDLNYDGVINVSDLFQIYNTLQTRCD